MKADNPFDRMLALPQVQRMNSIANTAPYIVDTLELAWRGCLAVFEEAAKPEHALMLLPHFLAAAEAERQGILTGGRARTDNAPPPPAKRRKAPKPGP